MPTQLPADPELRRLILRAATLAGEVVEICDLRGRYLWVNDSFERLFGHARAGVLGRTPAAVLRSDAHPPDYHEAIWAEIMAGRTWRGPLISKAADGRLVHTEMTVTPVMDRKGDLAWFVAVKRDRSHEVALEQRLARAEARLAVDRLAVGLAHEINNPLTYLFGNLELVESGLREMLAFVPPDKVGAVLSRLDKARRGADRIQALVGDLQTFESQTQVVQGEPVDLHRVLDLSIDMARHEIEPHARVERDYGSLPGVRGDRERLGQVFLNLLLNAGQAIPRAHPGPHLVRVATRPVDQGVEVHISDTGKGIPADLRDRIFEPFVTSRGGAGGTGLGLAICRNLVETHGGQVSVESEVGRGTTFRVRLPTGA